MARRSGSIVRHPARVAVISVGCAAFFGAIAGGRALLLPAAPMTWIVDDDGGAGVHFTDIQPALDAAVDGDLVLVHPGDYSNFTLTESLSILGLPGGTGAKVPVGNAVGIAGEAAVAGLTFNDFNATGCTGTLVLDSLLFRSQDPILTIQGCADVRVLGADAAGTANAEFPAVVVDGSTAELVSCLLAGEDGHDNLFSSAYAGDGANAVSILGGSRVYVALSQATGGDGGDFVTQGFSGYGGEGGAGIDVADGDLLLLGRGAELIKGGQGGASLSIYGYGGGGGDGTSVKAGSSLRHSNVKFAGGKGGNAIGYIGYSGSPGQPLVVFSGGSAAKATPPDPSLERTAVAQAGGVGNIKLRTKPGVFSRLFVGNVPTIQPSLNVFVDSLVIKETTYALGFAPATGVVNASFPLDPSWTPGTVVYAQAMSIFPGGQIRRTNSVPFVVH